MASQPQNDDDEPRDPAADASGDRPPMLPPALIAVLGLCALLMGVGGLIQVGLLDLSLPGMFMGLASVVFLLALAALWQSLRSAFGGGPELTMADVGALTDRSALEDEKTTLLRAIKDITYEHAVGKISNDDFARLNVAYRQRAKEVLRLLDQDLAPFLAKAQQLLDAPRSKSKRKTSSAPKSKSRSKKARAREAAVVVEEAPSDEEADTLAADEVDATEAPEARIDRPVAEPSAQDEAEPEAIAPERPARATKQEAKTDRQPCPSCGVANDLDAVFCKGCATRLAPMVCVKCSTENDVDARFCKGCAAPLQPAGSGDEEE